jgi:hypothetical protein
MGEYQDMNARNEQSLRRFSIVEKWWNEKLNKAVKEYEVLWK